MDIIIYSVLAVLVFVVIIVGFLSRYRMCSPDRILVVYGKVGGQQSAKCIHGGSTFVLPIFQSYAYLDLRPININVPLKGALSSQNIRIDAPANFTVGISTEEAVMSNAATRLLGSDHAEISDMAREIIIGQMRVVIASMTIEEINADREKLITNIVKGVDTELNKVGLKMINVNITDITDASGYIEALGREAAARAINEANIKVADETRKGEVGRAEAERQQAVAVAEARAAATAGENMAKIQVAQSNAELAVKEAQALQLSEIAKKVQDAKVLEEGYRAQQQAQLARAELEKATLEASKIVPAEVAKRELEIQAEAEAERRRRIEKGNADALLITRRAEGEGTKAVLTGEADGLKAKLLAEAEGAKAILDGRAQGFQKIIEATGNDAQAATQLLITERIVEIAQVQGDAIKGINFGKVIAMGDGASDGFLNGLLKNILSLHEVAASAGIKLPDYLGAQDRVPKPPVSAPILPVKKKEPAVGDGAPIDDRGAI